ncbi:MAG: hypothetical protein ACYC5J_14820 [Chloroflexota bacterium]
MLPYRGRCPARTHLLAPDRLYAAAGDGFMAPGNGYAESRDGGDSWERIDIPWPERFHHQHAQGLEAVG